MRDLFGEMRKDGASTSKIKKLRAALSAMFATAVDDGLIRSNPAAGIRIPGGGDSGGDDQPKKALTREDLSIFLAAAQPKWRLFFQFLSHTGLRISEAVGLTWRHLDLGESPHVKVREQFYKGERKRLKSTQARRDVPLSPEMVETLLAHRRDGYGGEDAPVFASTTGSELTPTNVYRRALAPAAVAAGLTVERDGKKRSAVSFHTFRHTCASLLFESGKNIKQVQEWLGHADPGFTLRTYVHLMDAGIGDAAFMDEAVTVGVS